MRTGAAAIKLRGGRQTQDGKLAELARSLGFDLDATDRDALAELHRESDEDQPRYRDEDA